MWYRWLNQLVTYVAPRSKATSLRPVPVQIWSEGPWGGSITILMTATLILLLQLPSTDESGEKIPLYAGRVCFDDLSFD
jgi:hypothetical protein